MNSQVLPVMSYDGKWNDFNILISKLKATHQLSTGYVVSGADITLQATS